MGNPVDVGTLVKSRALIAQIPSSHIIHENEEDIRPLRIHAEQSKHEEEGNEKRKSVEFHYGNLRKLLLQMQLKMKVFFQFGGGQEQR